jgi:hypothetical protein
MAIQQATCTSFKSELLIGTHVIGTDTLKIALFQSSATLGASTTAYSATGEAAGTGYVAGGATLSGVTITTSGTTVYVTFTNPTWAGSSITARGALIYNSSKSNKAIAVIDFGENKTTAGTTFQINLPTADATNAIIRLV